MVTYEEYTRKKQEEVNALPLKWAFSDKQFEEVMRGWGYEPSETDKICRIKGWNGAFIRKTDLPVLEAFLNKEDELPKLMEDKEFRISAFLYEMNNHEYAINTYQGDWEVCGCFSNKGLKYEDGKGYMSYLDEMGHQDWIDDYKEARKRHYKMANDNDWF